MSEFWTGKTTYSIADNWDLVSQDWDRLVKYLGDGINRKRIMDGIKNEYIYGTKENIEKILGLSILSTLSLTGETFHWDDKEIRQIKTDWINWLQDEGFFMVYEKGKKNEDIPDAIITLMDEFNSLTELDEKYFHKHKNIEDLLNKEYGLCAENPLFEMFKNEDMDKRRYWFGQSDLTLLEGDTLYVVDFKPEKNLNTENTRDHFVNAFLQVIGYALSTKMNIDKELKVKCVVFNGEGQAVVFDPIEMFAEIQKFMSGK
ncbi:MAG: hypothetical protein GF311_03210, partial [Candidatus Lokiarchaeota archaeon]|nr:hypothetical protein [Candidatus Lokiarchaeota archaeon]